MNRMENERIHILFIQVVCLFVILNVQHNSLKIIHLRILLNKLYIFITEYVYTI